MFCALMVTMLLAGQTRYGILLKKEIFETRPGLVTEINFGSAIAVQMVVLIYEGFYFFFCF
jgi:hypothetical protein